MKKIILVFLIMTIIIGGIIFFTSKNNNELANSETSNEKITIIATLFPQYDFAREVGKDKVEVKLLLPSGAESHDYEPTAKDYVNINKADIFAYTGKEMEPWAEKIATSINSNTIILDVSKNIDYIKEEHNEGEEHEEHEHEYDPHIWLDINNACIMVDNIANALVEIDSQNAGYYLENAEKYKEKLMELDNDIYEVVSNAKRNKIVFGGTFSYAYFVKRYGLEYISAYDSCTDLTEPSTSKVKEVIDYIDENSIPVVFYPELSSAKVAKMIASETNTKTLEFNSIHNVTEEEMEQGVNYITLMQKNIENLKIALN